MFLFYHLSIQSFLVLCGYLELLSKYLGSIVFYTYIVISISMSFQIGYVYIPHMEGFLGSFVHSFDKPLHGLLTIYEHSSFFFVKCQH